MPDRPKGSTPEQIRAQMQAQAAAILAEGMVLASFQHKGVAGIEREQPIRRFLASHLPGRFLVGQGSIASAEIILGNQHDIIVADRDASFSLLNTVSAQLLTIESMHLIVEVRTTFGDLEGVGNSLRAVRKLRCSPGLRQLKQNESEVGCTAPPVQTLIIYQGPMAETAIKHLIDVNSPDAGRLSVDSVLVLSRDGKAESGYLIGYSRTDPQTKEVFSHHYYPQANEPGMEGPRVITEGADSFAYWYAGLLNHLNGVIAFPPNLYSYLGEEVKMTAWTNRPY